MVENREYRRICKKCGYKSHFRDLDQSIYYDPFCPKCSHCGMDTKTRIKKESDKK